MNKIQELCTKDAGHADVLQGNMAFAVGCVRAGIHAADGYPGTPSTEVIDKTLAQVQDKIKVGWSISEATALGVGVGYTYAGQDCVVTMKIPGLYQAGDIFTSIATFPAARGALLVYVASDFTPSSTQHVIDPRYLYKSCFVPVFEPRNHQEMHEAAGIAVEIGRKYNTSVVIHASGLLCHSEGLVRLMPLQTREPAAVAPLNTLISLPNITRMNHDTVMTTRLPALMEMVEASPLNQHIPGSGKMGVITYGSGAMHVAEYKAKFQPDLDILSLAFTNPLPLKKIKAFVDSIKGPVYVVEDGYRFVQESCLGAGIAVEGKTVDSKITEWSPASLATFLGQKLPAPKPKANPLPRPPMICAGCPYRLTGEVLKRLKKRGELEAIFGDIGCNTLLYFMQSLDTALAMGASESIRAGYVMANPEKASKCISLLGDGTECHSGLDATRNSLFRQVPGVKIILDNEWTAMTGGQPSPASPHNLAGQPNKFNLAAAVASQGATVLKANAYNLKEIQTQLKAALAAVKDNAFTVLIIKGTCIRKVQASSSRPSVDLEKCKRCGSCQICPGMTASAENSPIWNNLCSGCMGQDFACAQMCPVKAISPSTTSTNAAKLTLPIAPIPATPKPVPNRPQRLALAIRGVGGQGNLFFGKILSQVAFLAGYGESNILKGETHGMAQMGGPVISTFLCGDVHSPELMPGTADCLIVMEKSEILRPGFLDLLKPGGTILMANTEIQPPVAAPYPSEADLSFEGYNIQHLNPLDISTSLGDVQGKAANVIMLGKLANAAPFNTIPAEVWLKALHSLSPKAELWNLNYAAFNAGYNQ